MSNQENNLKICRVCGFENETLIWGEDENTPSFDLCPCCGAEFGFDDPNIESVRKYRSFWIIEKELKWTFPEFKPKEWSFLKQLKNISKKWI